MERESIRKLIAYLDGLCVADEAVEAGKKVGTEPEMPKETVEQQKTSYRNIALAGSGYKAEIMGTLTTEPTVAAKELTALGLDTKTADELITKRDMVRADAVALTAAAVK